MTLDRAPLRLEPSYCRQRQQAVRSLLDRLRVDRAVLVRPEHVQYLTGFRPHRLMTAAVSLDVDGFCLLVAPKCAPDSAAADHVVCFEAQWHSTLRQDQSAAAAEALRQAAGRRPAARRMAVEWSAFGPHMRAAATAAGEAELVDIEPELWSLRRRKYPDELAMIRRAIDCTEAMYAHARTIVRPGVTEIEVFNALHAVAVDVAGEPLTDLGNDYQCASPGGAPRSRVAQAGELFILDLGPAYRGYYADNCRTFAVDGRPTAEQLAAWRRITDVLAMFEQTARAGVRCRDLFHRAQTMLDAYRPGAFHHHLGHGFGLFPHEAPHLNPNWDDTLDEGDVVTVEPGLYGPELRAGIRIEQDYRVTADGVERLTAYPTEL
jgi:Xaa-Pro aminopeptidase